MRDLVRFDLTGAPEFRPRQTSLDSRATPDLLKLLCCPKAGLANGQSLQEGQEFRSNRDLVGGRSSRLRRDLCKSNSGPATHKDALIAMFCVQILQRAAKSTERFVLFRERMTAPIDELTGESHRLRHRGAQHTRSRTARVDLSRLSADRADALSFVRGDRAARAGLLSRTTRSRRPAVRSAG